MHDLRRLVHPESVINRLVYMNVPERQGSARAREEGSTAPGERECFRYLGWGFKFLVLSLCVCICFVVSHKTMHAPSRLLPCIVCSCTKKCVCAPVTVTAAVPPPVPVPPAAPNQSKARTLRQASTAAALNPCPDGTQVCDVHTQSVWMCVGASCVDHPLSLLKSLLRSFPVMHRSCTHKHPHIYIRITYTCSLATSCWPPPCVVATCSAHPTHPPF